MRQKPSILRFFAAPLNDKFAALEAIFELAFARLNTLASAKHFTSLMGELEGRPVAANRDQQIRAARIGYIVEQMSRRLPFRCVCLQQALASRRMLKRRHLPATVYLGVLPEEMPGPSQQPDRRDDMLPGSAAHAWVKSGDRVINGDSPDLGRYVVLGIFS